jgi:hypothetical protein
MSKLTIDARRDNQEVTGVTAEERAGMSNSNFGVVRRNAASYRVICAARSPFRAIDCIMTLARTKTVAPATTSASKIVMFISPPMLLSPLQHYREARERLPASQESSEL